MVDNTVPELYFELARQHSAELRRAAELHRLAREAADGRARDRGRRPWRWYARRHAAPHSLAS